MNDNLFTAAIEFYRALNNASDAKIEEAQRLLGRYATNSPMPADLEPMQNICEALQTEKLQRTFKKEGI